MLQVMFNFLKPRVFVGEENKTRSASYVHWISLAFILGVLAYEILGKIAFRTLAFTYFDGILFLVFLILFTIFFLAKWGYVRQAGAALSGFLWLVANITAYFGFGVRDSAYIANFMILLATGLLLGWKAAVFFSGLTILSGIALALAEVNGISPGSYYPSSPLIVLQDMIVVLAIFAVFIYLLISGLENAIKKAQAGTKELELSNRDLQNARQRLEENRNQLLAANERLAQRAEKINEVANISKTITVVMEIERLLPSVVNAISDRLGYQHVGIYLLDESKQVAYLRASSSEEGLRRLRNRHRVNLLTAGLMGVVIERGEARLVLPEGVGPTANEGTDFADTRSHLMLPLKVREVVIGTLDIQSPQADAFMQEDVSTLQILADQVAVAYQNARSSEQAQEALKRAELATSQVTGEAWREYLESLDRKGYRYDGIKPEPIYESAEFSGTPGLLTIPVRLRGQIIGRLKLNPPETSRQWTEDEIAIVEATAERVALALESARLLEDAQKRAHRETFLAGVSARLGSSFQLDSILRDTVEELGQTFNNTTVSFQLVNPRKSNGNGSSARESGDLQSGKDFDQA